MFQLEAEVDHPEVGQAHMVEVIREELHFVAEAVIAVHRVVVVGVVEELDGMALLLPKSVMRLVLSHKSMTMVLKAVIQQMCPVVVVVQVDVDILVDVLEELHFHIDLLRCSFKLIGT